MSQLNDSKFIALRSQGYAGAIDDMEAAWELDNNINSDGIAWRDALLAAGVTSGHINDMELEFWTDFGGAFSLMFTTGATGIAGGLYTLDANKEATFVNPELGWSFLKSTGLPITGYADIPNDGASGLSTTCATALVFQDIYEVTINFEIQGAPPLALFSISLGGGTSATRDLAASTSPITVAVGAGSVGDVFDIISTTPISDSVVINSISVKGKAGQSINEGIEHLSDTDFQTACGDVWTCISATTITRQNVPEVATLVTSLTTSPATSVEFDVTFTSGEALAGEIVTAEYISATGDYTDNSDVVGQLSVPTGGSASIVSNSITEIGPLPAILTFDAPGALSLISVKIGSASATTVDLNTLTSPHEFLIASAGGTPNIVISQLAGIPALINSLSIKGIATQAGLELITDTTFSNGCGADWTCAGGAAISLVGEIAMADQLVTLVNSNGVIPGLFVTVGTGADYASIELAAAAIPALLPTSSAPIYMRLTQETHQLVDDSIAIPDYSGVIGEVIDRTKCIVNGVSGRTIGLLSACFRLGLDNVYSGFTLNSDATGSGAGWGSDTADVIGTTVISNMDVSAEGEDTFYMRGACILNVSDSNIGVLFDGFAMFGNGVRQLVNLDDVHITNDPTRAGGTNFIRVDHPDTEINVIGGSMTMSLPVGNLNAAATCIGSGVGGNNVVDYDLSVNNCPITIDYAGAHGGSSYAVGINMHDGRLDLLDTALTIVNEVVLLPELVQDSLLKLGSVKNLTKGIVGSSISTTSESAAAIQWDLGENVVSGFKIP